ncbi:MAG: amidohydrolase [Myxococcales bacterium]|nr:amidohydrolase [Myxococcota bacterium]MDW8280214.1 amidohydrolase [Myxococcales bacterium]
MRCSLTLALLGLVWVGGGGRLQAAEGAVDLLREIAAIEPDLHALYRQLHQHPELSLHEQETAARLAARLRALGIEVTVGVGGHGIVGVVRNGEGPVLMLRTDLDGLPVREETGLPYASRVVVRNEQGQEVPVMHACGHDLHMASWIGAATVLLKLRERWRGTLLLVGQPAEEQGDGAKRMIEAGLLRRFPRPSYALAIHDSADLPAGQVGYTAGFALANVDSVDITVFGKGGHGAYPHTTVDPVVLAARIVLALQTLVSREKDPLEPAVVTVGSIHGGTRHNIIPDEVSLQLTVRSYSQTVRQQLLDGIRRIVEAEAQGAGAPRRPRIVVSAGTPATYNDPQLVERVAAALVRALGADRVIKMPPVMGGEDFSEYGRAGVPSFLYWIGAVRPDQFAAARRNGTPLPSLHSSRFAPAYEPALRTAVHSLVVASLELLGRP